MVRSFTLYFVPPFWCAASVSKRVCLTDLEQFPWRKADGTKTSWSYYVFRRMSELIFLLTSAALINLWASAGLSKVMLLLLLLACKLWHLLPGLNQHTWLLLKSNSVGIRSLWIIASSKGRNQREKRVCGGKNNRSMLTIYWTVELDFRFCPQAMDGWIYWWTGT